MTHLPSKTRKKLEWLLRRAEGALLDEDTQATVGRHLDPAGALEPLEQLAALHRELGLDARLIHLAAAREDVDDRKEYVHRYGCAGVRRFPTATDARLYVMSVETFPRHVNNIVLVVEPGHTILFDVGSGSPSSRRDLALGFAVVRSLYGEDVAFERIDLAIVSHAHIDHFGGVADIKQKTSAKLLVHELDARVIAGFEERLVVASKDVDVFLRRAGVDDGARAELLAMYGSSRELLSSQVVDRELRDGDIVGDGNEVIHVPGHCPGLVCLRVGDVLLTSDHVLARISPHQFPQAITPFAGLEHYFHSLEKVRRLSGITLAIGGHEEPIDDLEARIDEIAAFHRERLEKTREICRVPRTIYEVTREMFGAQEGYGRLLAIEEAGAHVEYLHTLGRLRIANLDEVAAARDPVIQYVAREASPR